MHNIYLFQYKSEFYYVLTLILGTKVLAALFYFVGPDVYTTNIFLNSRCP
jgi:hypothetical protein